MNNRRNIKLILSIIIVAVIFVKQSECIKKHKKHGCKRLVGEFGDINGRFTYCVISNSVPVAICEKCIDLYNNLTVNYNNIFNNETCREIYFNQNRLNTFESIFSASKNLWDKAFCSECFDSNSNISNDTLEILEKINEVNDCIEKKPNPCIDCEFMYAKTNEEYENIAKEHNGNICFDIQDAMNQTRIDWSKKLKCCKRIANLKIFTILSSLFSLLPFIFYGGVIFYTKRRENAQETLTTDFENRPTEVCNNQDMTEENGTINQLEPEPSTSSTATKAVTKSNWHEENDDEDLLLVDTSVNPND